MNTEPKNDAWQDVRKPLSSRAKRHLLFLATYFLGAIVVFLTGAGYNIFPGLTFSFPNPLIIIGALIFLPMGLGFFPYYYSDMLMTERPQLAALLSELIPWLLLLSYILIFLIPLFGSSTEKPRTFRLLYLIFVALLIMNVAGCLSSPLTIP